MSTFLLVQIQKHLLVKIIIAIPLMTLSPKFLHLEIYLKGKTPKKYVQIASVNVSTFNQSPWHPIL